MTCLRTAGSTASRSSAQSTRRSRWSSTGWPSPTSTPLSSRWRLRVEQRRGDGSVPIVRFDELGRCCNRATNRSRVVPAKQKRLSALSQERESLGAIGGTRTPTVLPTGTSDQRAYQIHQRTRVARVHAYRATIYD